MSIAPLTRSGIWRLKSGIWADFAKSGILAKSGIWVFPFGVSALMPSIQISDDPTRNLTRNLDFISKINVFCQIPDFGKSTPKGVGGLPPQGGEVHHPPLGKFLGPKSGPEHQSDDGGRYRQASTAVVFHPSSQPEKETTHG